MIRIEGKFKTIQLGMNLFSPFEPEKEFKVYNSCKCSQIINVHIEKQGYLHNICSGKDIKSIVVNQTNEDYLK